MNELLTIKEASEILRVDHTTVRGWIKNGALASVALPSRGNWVARRIKRETMNNLLGVKNVE